MEIIYALVSLSFAGVNDLVFKMYGNKTRSVGLFLIGVGAVWASFFAGLAVLRNTFFVSWSTVAVGSTAGILSACANILLIEGMKRSSAAIAATIYRLNLVFVVLLAVTFLGESMSLLRAAGTLLAVAAVTLFSLPSGNVHIPHVATRLIAVLVLASFLRACMGISFKVAGTLAVSDEVFLAVTGVWWSLVGIVYYAVREHTMRCTAAVVRYAASSGALICGLVFFLKQAVNIGDASIAVTISQFSFLVTAPLAAGVLQERFAGRKIAGMALAVACIVIFSLAR